MIRRLVAVAAALSAVGGAVLAQAGGADTQDKGSAGPFQCGDNGTISWSPTELFPPNHKARDILVTYTDNDTVPNPQDPDNPTPKTVSLSITTNLHNEVVDGEEINGTGHTPFATDSTGGAGMDQGSVTVTAKAVAERSGHKNAQGGRVYEFDYDATSDDGDGCKSDASVAGDGILICVPHDMRAGGHCSVSQQPPTQKPTPPEQPAAPELPAAPAVSPQVVNQSVEQVNSGLGGLLGG